MAKIQKKTNYFTMANCNMILSIVAFLAVVTCYVRIGFLKAQNETLRAELQTNKIYYYNLENVIASSSLVGIRNDFETKLQALAVEVETAQRKIQSIKDAKVKDDFTEMYMKSLKLKRDDLLKAYDEAMMQATENVNVALQEIAKAKHVTTIFNSKALAVTTNNTIDLTNDVIEAVNKKNENLKKK